MLIPNYIIKITFKRKLTKKHQKNKNSKCPDINFIVIISFLKDLRCHIISGTTKSINILILLPSKAKITNLGNKLKWFIPNSGLYFILDGG